MSPWGFTNRHSLYMGYPPSTPSYSCCVQDPQGSPVAANDRSRILKRLEFSAKSCEESSYQLQCTVRSSQFAVLREQRTENRELRRTLRQKLKRRVRAAAKKAGFGFLETIMRRMGIITGKLGKNICGVFSVVYGENERGRGLTQRWGGGFGLQLVSAYLVEMLPLNEIRQSRKVREERAPRYPKLREVLHEVVCVVDS